MIDIEKAMHFSYDLETTMTDNERKVSDILRKIASMTNLKNENYNIIIHDYFENFVSTKLRDEEFI